MQSNVIKETGVFKGLMDMNAETKVRHITLRSTNSNKIPTWLPQVRNVSFKAKVDN